jgi:uncharacterized membrane protein
MGGSYFWFNICKDMEHDKLIVLFIITFTIYIISTYYKLKLENEIKSESKEDSDCNDKSK